MNTLKSKTALITGATSGIGEACAKKLAKKKTNLILLARRESKLEKLKKQLNKKYDIKIKILVLDVTNKKTVFEKLGQIVNKYKIDILINNAGLALGVEEITKGNLDNWEEMIDTNLKGLLYVSRIILPAMKIQNSGHIINLGSIAGLMTYPGGNVYCATKSAVHTLSEAMNIDLVHTNIRVSNISPGAVQTEFSNVRFKGDKRSAKKVYEGYTPLKAQDIADLIVYVLSVPEHINIQHTLIMPTAQRNPYLLNKKSEG